MKRRFCILILFFCCCIVGVAAQSKKQSGLRSSNYLTYSIKDSIDALNELADTLCLHKDEEGTRLAYTALLLSK